MTDEYLDFTFIEIKPVKDKINYFLEVDKSTNDDEKILNLIYRRKPIYVLHYPKSKNIQVSYGLSQNLQGYKIAHFCSTEDGSSGSPILSFLFHHEFYMLLSFHF